jgi:hypothetical protein
MPDTYLLAALLFILFLLQFCIIFCAKPKEVLSDHCHSQLAMRITIIVTVTLCLLVLFWGFNKYILFFWR